MSPTLAVALLALLVGVFALLAVAAVYSRVRTLEQTALSSSSDRLADVSRVSPASLLPQAGQAFSLVVLMDAACGICHQTWEAVSSTALPGVRLIGLLAEAPSSASFTGDAVMADPDLWSNLYEGYSPCLYVIAPSGDVVDRRFVYGDTDIPGLLRELLSFTSAASKQRSTNAL
ncbi:hypothetical protein HS041_25340 [Planomonospora sp. ID67723]|uniref:hypothetical protein n=1 Tax=Planomonospora sp. ID67723 TaxID=2738134 RepID=UPI0018C3E105|nr:hypothetical protein [Planomonospora sp. ID67723]MBG0831089.1 hypothetical protein [Planomonospora sp. ID67723]